MWSCRITENYSASDLTALARDAAFGPIRGTEIDYWDVTIDYWNAHLSAVGMGMAEVSVVSPDQVVIY